MTLPDAAPARGLPALASEIRQEMGLVKQKVREAVSHAVRVGALLLEAKAQVRHGEWLPWLEENFPGTPQTARTYMRLAVNRAEIEGTTSIREAVAHLADLAGLNGKPLSNSGKSRRSRHRVSELPGIPWQPVTLKPTPVSRIPAALSASERNLDRIAEMLGVPRNSIPDTLTMRGWRRRLAEAEAQPHPFDPIIARLREARSSLPEVEAVAAERAIAVLEEATAGGSEAVAQPSHEVGA
jgi:hypothetical protein